MVCLFLICYVFWVKYVGLYYKNRVFENQKEKEKLGIEWSSIFSKKFQPWLAYNINDNVFLSSGYLKNLCSCAWLGSIKPFQLLVLVLRGIRVCDLMFVRVWCYILYMMLFYSLGICRRVNSSSFWVLCGTPCHGSWKLLQSWRLPLLMEA